MTCSAGVYQGPEKGSFEVTVGGVLIHSKLTKGHGKCQTDDELDRILEAIKSKTGL